MIRLDVTIAKKILLAIQSAGKTYGVEIYVVGGFVRDLYLGVEGKDLDFVVFGDAIKFAGYFRKKFHSSKVVSFSKFCTATVFYQDWKLEFVSARPWNDQHTSGESEAAKTSIESDLSRRDFTINCLAMYISPERFGEVIDYYEGIKDIENKNIRTPINPNLTFKDDPLRMIRAVRFSGNLNYHIDKGTLKAVIQNRPLLVEVSQERIAEEFRKIMLSGQPSAGLNLLKQTGLSSIIFPELDELAGVEQRQEYFHKDVFQHTLQVVDNISRITDKFELRMVALMHDIAKPQTKRFVEGAGWTFHGHEELGAHMVERIGRRMKLPLNSLKYIKKLVRLHMRPMQLVDNAVTDSAIRRLIWEAGEDLEDLMIMCRADITSKNPLKVQQFLNNFDKVESRVLEVEEKDKIRLFKPVFTGNDIMKNLSISPGPVIGKIKQAIIDAILDGQIPNEYDACYQYFIKIKNEFVKGPFSDDNN